MQIDIYRKIVIISSIKSRYVTIDYGKTVTFIEILFHLSIKEKYIENCQKYRKIHIEMYRYFLGS